MSDSPAVGAVARLVARVLFERQYPGSEYDHGRALRDAPDVWPARGAATAEALLTSDAPDVHAAMRDALVEVGVLREESVSRSRLEECSDLNCSSEPLTRVRTGDPGHCHTVLVTLRRYVTEWEELP